MSEIQRDNAKVAVLDLQDNILLIKRSELEDHRRGEWDWPGGKIEVPIDNVGTTVIPHPVDTAVEEGLQEIHLEFDKDWMRFLKVHDKIKSGRRIKSTWFFAAVVVDTDIELSWEHDEALWLPRTEFVESDLVIPSKYRDVLTEKRHIVDQLLDLARVELQPVMS